MREQILHLVGKHAPSFEIDVLGIRRCEGHRDQLQSSLFGRPPRFEVVASAASGHDVRPSIASALAQRSDVIARELVGREAHAAVHAEVRIALEQGLIVQRRRIVFAQIAGIMCVTDRCHDRVHVHDRLQSGARIRAAEQAVKACAAGIGNLFRVIKPHRVPVVNPLQGHS